MNSPAPRPTTSSIDKRFIKRGGYTIRIAGLLAATAVCALATACGPIQTHELAQAIPQDQMKDYLADKPQDAQRLYSRVLIEGKRNEALNHMRAGLAAFQLGDDDNAAKSFDVSLNTIEAIYADNPKAAEARSLWTKENVKDFKGEPYERALAYYYRGLTYMHAGDYENARASFRGGILQSTFSYNERFDADFPLLNFLEGWAARCSPAGSSGKDSFDVAAKTSPALGAPPTENNVLILAEYGNPPMKVAKGKSSELLTFQPGPPSNITRVVIESMADGAKTRTAAFAAAPASDLFRQASTRNGRPIDGILEGKAEFKDATKTAGSVAMTTGAALMTMSNNSNLQGAGAALALVGMFASMAAEAMRPEADVRAWDNIPGTIAVTTLKASDLQGGGQPLQFEAVFYDPAGTEVGRKPVKIATAGQCSLGWVRARSALDVPDSAPGAIARR